MALKWALCVNRRLWHMDLGRLIEPWRGGNPFTPLGNTTVRSLRAPVILTMAATGLHRLLVMWYAL